LNNFLALDKRLNAFQLQELRNAVEDVNGQIGKTN